MGNYQSNISRQVATEINEIAFSSIASQITSATTNCTAGTVTDVRIGGVECGGLETRIIGSPVNISTTSRANCMLQVQSVAQTTADIASTLSSQIEQHAQQQGTAIQQWLSLALSFQVQEATTENQIINRVQRAFSQVQNTTCNQTLTSVANTRLLVCGTILDSPITVRQDASAIGVASCVNVIVNNILTNDSVLNRLAQLVDQASTVQQEGASSLFSGFTTALYVIGAIVVLVVVGGLIYTLTRPAQR